MIPAFDAERGVEEVRFCSDGGFRGVMLWQSPHPDLPFAGDHYDSIWREAEVRGLPVSLHILSGFSSREVLARGPLTSQGPSFFRGAINLKLLAAMDAVNDLIMSGVLHRFPGLRIVIVENEVGWLPFALTQLDYYYHRFHDTLDVTISQPPSVYAEQIYATFFRDAMTPHLFSWWGGETCMWSNDFPHGNSTWPNSRHLVERNLGGLPHDTVAKLLRGNAERLYGALPDTADDILKETAH